jgi:predicted dehydrogenase
MASDQPGVVDPAEAPDVTRVAVIGLGGVADRIHLPALRSIPEVEIVGACEPDAARREAMGRRFALGRLFPDAEALLAATKPDIAVIGSPPDSHHRLTCLALDHGAHVFCEKPFVRTPEEADAIVAAADRLGRLVAVNNQYRYMPIYLQAQQRVRAGEFGAPYLIQGWQQMFHPPSFESNWRAQLVESTLFEFGTHALDLVCFFFDALPDSITTHITHPRPEIAADVVVLCQLAFPGERAASLVLNRVSHAPERYFEMRVDCHDASIRISLGGVARLGFTWSKPLGRPITRFSFVKGGEARIERGGRAEVLTQDREQAFARATAAKFADFLGRIHSGTHDNSEARHARALIRVVQAGYESARAGRTVALNDVGPRS